MGEPFVDIVIPVYNGAQHLKECLDSILAQTYKYWRAIVVNNCSTDDTGPIAEEYAKRDRRLQVVHCKQFVGQSENYNRAVSLASSDAAYIKVVEADNWVTADCLTRLLDVAERDSGVGIVGSYCLMGREVVCAGLDYSVEILSGIDVGRMLFLEKIYLLGTPTSLLYRADAIRGLSPLFKPGLFYDDTDLCMKVLRSWKFGFVHQLLSYQRVNNDGIMSTFHDFDYIPAYRYFLLKQYGRNYLSSSEIKGLRTSFKREYLGRLAHAAIIGKSEAYWKFHKRAFELNGDKLRRKNLLFPVFREWVSLMLNLESTIKRLRQLMRQKRRR